MSLEEALHRNTETMERLIKVLEGQSKVEVVLTRDTTPVVESVVVDTPAVEEPIQERPKRRGKTPKSEPVAEVAQEKVASESKSLFDEPSQSTIPSGSAPVNEGSEWYRYTLELCSRYSAMTGDPAKTQAIMHKHGVTNLSSVQDAALVPIALEIEPFLGIKR